MLTSRLVMFSSLCNLLLWVGVAHAQTKVEIKGVHMCCQGCVLTIEKIMKEVKGVQAECDQDKGIVTLTVSDTKTAQKALDALAEGGFHGQSGNKELAMKDDSSVPAGKVKALSLTGIHNCCGACNRAIKAALKSVPGVTGDTSKAKSRSFEVTGDFEASEVVKALNAAGFHVKVKKE